MCLETAAILIPKGLEKRSHEKYVREKQKRVAKKDITVFKILKVWKLSDGRLCYLSPYYFQEYVEGVVKSPIEMHFLRIDTDFGERCMGSFSIHKGLHSYSLEIDAQCMAQACGDENTVIAKMIVPKGSVYYQSNSNNVHKEVVSDQLRWAGEIVFRRNKFHKPVEIPRHIWMEAKFI